MTVSERKLLFLCTILLSVIITCHGLFQLGERMEGDELILTDCGISKIIDENGNPVLVFDRGDMNVSAIDILAVPGWTSLWHYDFQFHGKLYIEITHEGVDDFTMRFNVFGFEDIETIGTQTTDLENDVNTIKHEYHYNHGNVIKISN